MNGTAKDRALTCWVVTDGRAGIEAQAVGLAEAIAKKRPTEIVKKQIAVRAPWRFFPRMFLGDPFGKLSASSDRLAPPYPDLWIGCGRLSVPLSIAAKEKSPPTFTVQLQHPRAPLGLFDLVIAPEHDGLSGDNVLSIIGSTMRPSARSVEPLQGTGRVAVLIGGPNRAFEFSAADADEIARQLEALALKGAKLCITTSRRTPKAAADILELKLKEVAEMFWRADCGENAANPYPQMLQGADAVLVTEDSVNMAIEAASTGAPVYVLRLKRRPFASAKKFDAFHESLNARGVTKSFEGELQRWSYPPLDETARAADEVLRRIG